MSAQDQKSLPPEVITALQRGNLIEAIRLLRKAGNIDLKQAKEAIERHLDRSKVAKATVGEAFGSLVQIPAVAEAMRKGNKIEAIRILREKTGLGLKEAKDAVDRFGGHSMGEAATADASRQKAAPTPTRFARPGLAPGEVPYSAGGGIRWLLVVIIVIGALIYYVASRFG